MKKLNRKFIKGTNWALAGLITLLGFSSCSDDFDNRKNGGIPNNGENNNSSGGNDDGGDIICEYGTPYAEFVVSGKVTDIHNQGLQGIRVVVPRADHHQRTTPGFIPGRPLISQEIHDTTYTKENGDFEYKYIGFPTNDSINVIMEFEDMAENPRFDTDSVKVSFFSSDLKDGNGWYHGKTKKEVKIELKNKESE